MQRFIDSLPLIDHHCMVWWRGRWSGPPSRLMSEGHKPVAGCTQFDKPLGLVLLRWCAPQLGSNPTPSPRPISPPVSPCRRRR